MRLEAHDLFWKAGNVQVLQDVTIDVKPGETLGLIGPNGSGKSTLLRLLSGICEPTSGQVLLDRKRLGQLGRRAVAQQIAFVEQQAETSEHIGVRDAVELGRTPWLNAFASWSARDECAVSDALAQVEMAHMAHRTWHTLSGGEKQRVHLARALAQQPRLLLLDEPTNHLDIHHQLAILTLVRALPVTTVIALHDLNQAAAYCDRIAVMDGGNLVACGPSEEVLTPELIRTIFGVEAHILPDPLHGHRHICFLGSAPSRARAGEPKKHPAMV